MTARVDYNITSHDQIYVRYNTDHGVQATGTDAINSAFNANSVQPSYGGQFGYTKTIGSSMLTSCFCPPPITRRSLDLQILPLALKTFPTPFTFADGLYSNLGGIDSSYPQRRKVRQWQLVDDYSVTRGNQTIKFRVNTRKKFVSTYAYGSGTSGLFTFFSMTDFLNASLDNGSTYAQTFSKIGAEDLKFYSGGFYGSFSSVAHNVATPYNQVIGTGLKQAFPSVEPMVFAPRTGFAYSVGSKTVVRGGFGIFSDLNKALMPTDL